MLKLQTAIVDDEPLARQILEEYVSKVGRLELVISAGNPVKFVNFLREHPVDLVFLDINMPELNGMQVLDSLVKKPHIIITTAYSDYALKSYDYDVADYLLKPIAFGRFIRAIGKVCSVHPTNVAMAPSKQELLIKVDGMPVYLPSHSILYIQSFGNYLKVFTEHTMYLITETLVNISGQLPGNFQQTHKSYIANLNRVKKIANASLRIETHTIPISATYKLLTRQKIELYLDPNKDL